MFQQKRALLEEFCEQMELAGVWPTEEEFKLAAGRYAAGTLTAMRRGQPVAAKYCVTLVRMRNEPGRDAFRKTIAGFVQDRGLSKADSENDTRILDTICRPIGDERDWIADGISAIGYAINARRLASRTGRPCQDVREVMQAIRWMYIDCARLRSRNPMLEPQAAIQLSESWAKISLEDYQRRAISWWKFDPRIVMVAIGDKRPIAMTLILPLKEPVWNDIRSGQRASYAVSDRDLCIPSSYLMHEGLGQRPHDEGGEAKPYTRATFVTILRQMGTLAEITLPPRADLHSLTIAVNDLARQRIVGFGYKQVGTRMKTLDVDLFEKRFDRRKSHRTDVDSLTFAVLAMLRDETNTDV